MDTLNNKIAAALDQAHSGSNGRYAKLTVNDGPLRQTIVALTEGVELQEHNSPPAASMLVLKGTLRVTAQEDTTLEEGDLEALTHYRHSVTAMEDSVFLLTTVTSQADTSSHDAQPE